LVTAEAWTCVSAPGNCHPPSTTDYNLAFSYDRYGSMTCVLKGATQRPCPQLGYGTSPTNRIATYGGSAVSYDLAGDLTNDGAYTYQYDGEGRLIRVSGSGVTNTYTYDALGSELSGAWFNICMIPPDNCWDISVEHAELVRAGVRGGGTEVSLLQRTVHGH
jgi:hypothetical protein